MTQDSKCFLLADGQEPAAATPLIVKPTEIENAPAAVDPKTGNIAVAMAVLPDGTHGNYGKLPLEFRVFGAESEEMLDSGGFHARLSELFEHILRFHRPVKMD